MTAIRTALITTAIAFAACTSKDEAKPAGTSSSGTTAAKVGDKPAPPPAGLTGERRTLTMKGYTIDMQLPRGWAESAFGEGVLFTAPGKSYYPSTMFVTPGCQGNCATVADNVAAFLESQKKMHEDSGYTVEVKSQGELAGGGRTFQLAITRDGETHDQVVAIAYQPGWDLAVTCSATLLAGDRVHLATFASWCGDMKIARP